MGEYYYSLHNQRKGNVTVGSLDYTVSENTVALPTAYYRPNIPTLTVVNANIPGVIVTYIDPNILFKEDLPTGMYNAVEKLTAWINEDNMINMNPVLQLLHVKKLP